MTIARGQPMLASDILDLTFFPVGSILMMDGSWTDGRGGWYICDGRATPHGNTPNLKDKFIRGGTTSGVEGGSDTGSANVDLTADNLPAHSHPLSGNLTTSNESQGHTHVVTADGTVANGGAHSHSVSDPGHNHRIDIGPRNGGSMTVSDGGARGGYTGIEPTVIKTGYTGVSVTASGSSHDHAFTGKQVTSGDVNKNHTHTLALSGSTGNSTGSSLVSVPVSVNTVPVYYTMIYIKKMV